MSTIGNRFKKIRQELTLSQELFGARLGMSKSGISAVENDKVFVSVDVLRTLFFDLNVNLNWFISGKGEIFNPPEFEDVKADILREVDDILIKYGVKNK